MPLNPISRRRLLTLLPGVVLIAGGVACGDDDDDESGDSQPTTEPTSETTAAASPSEAAANPSQAASPSTDAASAFPVTIEHALGTTTIDAEPQRVVALIDRDADTLIALGVMPVAIRSRYGFERGVGPWGEAALGDATPTVWTDREFDFEAIAAQNPDLIVNATSDGDKDVYDRLSGIAPTIALPKGAVAWGATIEQVTLLIAAALGREADGQKLLDDMDAFFAEQAEAYPQFAGKTANYLDISENGITSYSSEHVVNGALYSVGFSPIEPAAQLTDGPSVSVSPERVVDYDADIVLIYPFGRTLEELEAAIPTLASLDSVANGRAFVLEDLAFSNSSVLSIPYALENLLPKFAAALE